jgi:hypothetical protein
MAGLLDILRGTFAPEIGAAGLLSDFARQRQDFANQRIQGLLGAEWDPRRWQWPVPDMQAEMTPELEARAKEGFGRAVGEVFGAGVTKGMKPTRTYYRYTNSESPQSRGGFMLFASNRDDVSTNYGKNQWTTTDNGAVDASDLIDKIRDAFEGHPDVLRSYGASAERLASEFDPENIVNSAGGWDAEDLVEIVWRDVLEPENITKIRTANGLISFDLDSVKRK